MNAYTTTNATAIRPATSGFARFFRTLCTELRRAIELAGEPYQHGAMPPL